MFILNLHGLGTPPRELADSEQRVWLEPARFEALLDFAKTRSDLQFTFDDANESDYTIALPALLARGMKARFFIVAGRVDRPGFLSRRQVEGLQAAGMGIGNHGMHHQPWAGLDKIKLEEEVVIARDQLEKLTGSKIHEAACPFGSYNRRVIRALQSAGYSRIHTSDGGPAKAGALMQSRHSVYRTDELDALQRMISEGLSGTRRLARDLKLLLKRWR